jgi:2-keto-4-pentenoate hydratase/2-oxohepta-3-ene-1,7-dioic acid hydratase in catechol pathway
VTAHPKTLGSSRAATPKPARPRIFFKAPTAVTGPDAAIAKPAVVTKLDFEGELAAVIGRRARAVSEGEALDYLAGLTIANDVSAREFQFDITPAQTSFAKSMDGFCPLGPWIVTPDELPPSRDLRLRTWLNDTLMQEARTGTMIYGLPVLIAYLSRHMTLEPGDIISTGTPEGTGHFRKPPRYLGAGDRVRIEIESIGRLENTIV